MHNLEPWLGQHYHHGGTFCVNWPRAKRNMKTISNDAVSGCPLVVTHCMTCTTQGNLVLGSSGGGGGRGGGRSSACRDLQNQSCITNPRIPKKGYCCETDTNGQAYTRRLRNELNIPLYSTVLFTPEGFSVSCGQSQGHCLDQTELPKDSVSPIRLRVCMPFTLVHLLFRGSRRLVTYESSSKPQPT